MQSIGLWCNYLTYVRNNDPSVRELLPPGIVKARKLFELALSAGGLHASEGSAIWKAYREFEQSILDNIDENDTEAWVEQRQCIDHIFRRQLAVPHKDMQQTMHDYSSWKKAEIPAHTLSVYKSACEMYKLCEKFENQIRPTDMPADKRLKLFRDYLEVEKHYDDVVRVSIMYERAITELPTASQLWFDYIQYCEKTPGAGAGLGKLYSRAVKNCPLNGEFWVKYLLWLEHEKASEEEMAAVFDISMRFTGHVDLLFTRIDGLRRRLPHLYEGETLLKDTFEFVSDYLQVIEKTDDLLCLYAYWARLERRLGNDIHRARQIWEKLLCISDKVMGAWEAYISMELESGNEEEARALFKRCFSITFPGTGSKDICNKWVAFEREFGLLENLDYAKKEVASRLQKPQYSGFKRNPTEERDNSFDQNVLGKRKQAQRANYAGQMNTEAYADRHTAFVVNIHPKAKYQHLEMLFHNVEGVVSIRLRENGKAFVDFSDDTHLAAAVAKKYRLFGRTLRIERWKEKYAASGYDEMFNMNPEQAKEAIKDTCD